MKVLHINQSDIIGGAAISAFRLHQGLLGAGIESKLLVGAPQLRSNDIATAPRSPFLEKQTSRVAWRLGLNYINFHSTFRIRTEPFFLEADVINLHNLHGDYFNYLALPSLTEAKPTVWTLHDMWSFTGHCAYSLECARWRHGCGRCPYPEMVPSIKRDATRIEWRLKRWAYSRSRIVIVTPSRWLAALARESLVGSFRVLTIPHGLDTNTFKPSDSHEARAELGLPHGKRILMFAAENLDDLKKGGDLLVHALGLLPNSLKRECLLLLVGGQPGELGRSSGIETVSLGYISEDARKALAYSAADVFVLPTRADNLPLVLQESMACGTPMVSFAVGGVGELVITGETGYLARPLDSSDLARGICELLADVGGSSKLKDQCREIALREFGIGLMVDRYRELYQSIIAGE